MGNTIGDYWYSLRHRREIASAREVGWVYTVVLLVWMVYRVFSPFSVWFEELVVKGVVFGIPVYVVGRRLGWGWSDLGIRGEGLFRGVYLGIVMGLVLGVVGQLANVLRHGGLMVTDRGLTSEMMGAFILLALITAFWESLLFFGYIQHRLAGVLSESYLVLVVGMLFGVIHVPALIIVERMGVANLGVSLVALVLLGIGNSILSMREKNLIGPIICQVTWGMAVFLFG